MARFHGLAAVLVFFLSLFVTIMAQDMGTEDFGNFTEFINETYLDGLNSTDGFNVTDAGCEPACVGGRCVLVDEEPYCICEPGYQLLSDGYTCQLCPGGLYGVNCNNTCECGAGGNTCDKVNGTCICNMCYNGTSCGDSTGFECFVQFLANSDKNFGTLRETYGTGGFPVVPDIYQRPLIYSLADISDIDRGIIAVTSIETKSREEVGQGPLLQLKATLDKSEGSAAVQSAITTLQNKVKVGDIAATLIVQDSLDSTTAEVTLNAGIKIE